MGIFHESVAPDPDTCQPEGLPSVDLVIHDCYPAGRMHLVPPRPGSLEHIGIAGKPVRLPFYSLPVNAVRRALRSVILRNEALVYDLVIDVREDIVMGHYGILPRDFLVIYLWIMIIIPVLEDLIVKRIVGKVQVRYQVEIALVHREESYIQVGRLHLHPVSRRIYRCYRRGDILRLVRVFQPLAQDNHPVGGLPVIREPGRRAESPFAA